MDQSLIFCTVFDKNYLYQGVTLYRSLEKALSSFKLYVLALDDISVNTLRKLQLPNLIVMGLDRLKQDQVSEIRALTSYGQFCWAMQPLICRAVLDLGEPNVTYIEADSCFFASPIPLFQEIGSHAAAIARHWYAPERQYLEKISGRYCTHFNFFRNNETGLKILELWRTENFQHRKEKPLFYPGQLGLEKLALQFKEVWVLKNRGGGVAPWNIQQYQISQNLTSIPTINGEKIIFYHFHQLVRTADGSFELGTYPLSRQALDFIYKPYVRALLLAEQEVKEKVPEFHYRREIPPVPHIFSALFSGNIGTLKKAVQPLRRKLKGTYNVFPVSFFRPAS